MAISVNQKYNLQSAGYDWTDQCYIILQDLTEEAAKRYDATKTEGEDSFTTLRRVTDLIKSLFVSGKGMNNGELVDMTSDDVAILPAKVRSRLFEQIIGAETDPKDETPTTTS